MEAIMPVNILTSPGDQLKKAVQWISEQKQKQPDTKISTIIDQAGIKYDLSPKDLDFLNRKLDQ
jgi:hypothetical protein